MSRDLTVEEEKAAKIVADTKEIEVEKISNVFNLNLIFRVKARPGLWAVITQKNKSGMIGLYNMSDDKRIFTHVRTLEALGSFVIYTNRDSNYTLGNVLDEMFDLKTGVDDYFEQKATIPWFMERVAPGFDPDEFKDYHYKKIIKWFDILWDCLQKQHE